MKQFSLVKCGIAMLLLFSGSALAQGCPPGYYPYSNVNNGQTTYTCVPEADVGLGDYDNSGDATAAPVVRWADRWGAFASADNGAFGGVQDKTSKSQAESDALQQCESKGGSGCNIRLAYFNQCGAMASGTGGAGGGRAPTEKEAVEIAMKQCDKRGGGCQLYFMGCSLPERIQ